MAGSGGLVRSKQESLRGEMELGVLVGEERELKGIAKVGIARMHKGLGRPVQYFLIAMT